jgi:hypothetical protein
VWPGVGAFWKSNTCHVQVAPILRLDANIAGPEPDWHFSSSFLHRGLLKVIKATNDSPRTGAFYASADAGAWRNHGDFMEVSVVDRHGDRQRLGDCCCLIYARSDDLPFPIIRT